MTLPPQLGSAHFDSYPPKARALAMEALPLLKRLPLAFTPFLLKEIIGADVKFPVEMLELSDQLAYLRALPAPQLSIEMKPFAALTLSPKLEAFDWVHLPGQFVEQLSAHLWATHQMDTFRSASEHYVATFHAGLRPEPLLLPRAGVVVLGEGVTDRLSYPLFSHLQREGTVYTQVKPADGLAVLRRALEERAQAHPIPYGHWYVDGGPAVSLKGFATVGYKQLEPVRSALAAKMLRSYQAQHFDPEILRTSLAETTFESLQVKPSGDVPLDAFSLSLLTEGSGTQIYSTTFVQWAAREALRRAQPVTLYSRYSLRSRERSMAELLRGPEATNKTQESDARGSLIDADMGAYYTWLNQQRLRGADQSRFLVWFENHPDALVISPDQKRGAVNTSPVEFSALVRQVLM